jgi:hypothetical protein
MDETADVFPDGLPDTDRARWAVMTAAQRGKARARLTAIQNWMAGELEINEALAMAALSRSRFYRLAADWRASGSLEALGAFTGGGAARPRLDAMVINRLQASVPNVVAMNAGASVSQLARLLVKDAGVPFDQVPGVLRLRSIIETELRRVASSGEAGNSVRFDCTAINLPRENGRPHVMFACIDVGTSLILGAVVGAEPLSSGYAAAAADAKRWITAHRRLLPWALRLAHVEITSGVDERVSVELIHRIWQGGVRAHVQLARTPKRFGAYFRQAVGQRIGRIAITPRRTETGRAMPDNNDMAPWSHAEAAAALTAAVNAYNENIRSNLPPSHGRPPDDLTLLVCLMAEAMPEPDSA